MIALECMRHVLYVKKPLELRCMKMLKMHLLLGDMKTSLTFTNEHCKILQVINLINVL